MIKVHCNDCIYFTRFPVGMTHVGNCRFDAPVILETSGSKRGHFPLMNDVDWCGQGTNKDGERNS